MTDTIYTIEEIKATVKPIADKYNVDSIYLFGSYARGDATENSDLDFLVFGGDKFKLTNIFALAEDLRIAFKRRVDVFEISEVNTDSDFYLNIMNERLNVA
ncbi:MAG: nucleotidyltransferase domain-containing protein [Clostridia bacterium]|nr:nucleotidyltransferase domain-containing protein [Clostridia bacterium]